jgi:hypothetical protein
MASSLLACPFCREIYEVSEAESCPVCGVVLKQLHDLPPSFETREQLAAEWESTAPADRELPWWSLGRGRGALVVTSALGLAAFFAPWIVMTRPDLMTLSGFDLTGSRGFWFGGGAVGWFLNIPLVLSRRSINQMRSVRIIVTLFAGLTACQAALLWLLAPTDSLVPVAYDWGWGFHSSTALSAVGALLGVTFGGRMPEPPAAPLDPQKTEPDEPRTLH